MPAGVFAILDRKSNIATINKTASEILGLDSQSVIGRNALEVFGDRFPGIQNLINETIQNCCAIKNFNLEIEDRNGNVRTFLVSTAITEELDPVDFGVVLVLHDISEVVRLRKAAIAQQSFGQLVGQSPNMKQIYSLIETVAQFDTTVLIYGETGTGKELAALTVHQYSHRSDGPFIPISCSALSSPLLESELFGHVKGAFTGAIKDRQGRFEIAGGGTVFLDEVGTLSLDIQVKLLRTIQERVIERVGSSKSIPIDVRIIAATNRDLSELVAKNQFREDFYYRLKVFQINVPPLRERLRDIPVLADSFVGRFNKLYTRKVIGFSNAAKEQLIRYSWPGNVRELENAVEHAMVLTIGKVIEPQHLPPEIRHMNPNGSPPPPQEYDIDKEEENIRRALAAFSGNITRAATSLGMHRTTLWRKMRELGIERRSFQK
jgi:PAS domain S-box-containing protein